MEFKIGTKSFLLLATAVLLVSGCTPQSQTPDKAQDHSDHSSDQAMDQQDHSKMDHSHGDMSSMHMSSQISDEFTWEIKQLTPYKQGKPSKLEFKITDKESKVPVRNFEPVHEKIAHLIIVSRDLKHFEHLHPDITGPGTMAVQADFDRPGEYIFYMQFSTPDEGEKTIRQTLAVGKGMIPAAVLVPDAEQAKNVDGYDFKLTQVPDKSGEMAMPTVAITKNGKQVTNIKKFLGAAGHGVIVSEDTNSFLHVHPQGDENADSYASPVMFHTTVPKAGNYKMWAQFEIDGKVRTADFSFKVK